MDGYAVDGYGFVGQIMGSTGVSDKDMDDIVYSFIASSQFMEDEEEEG